MLLMQDSTVDSIIGEFLASINEMEFSDTSLLNQSGVPGVDAQPIRYSPDMLLVDYQPNPLLDWSTAATSTLPPIRNTASISPNQPPTFLPPQQPYYAPQQAGVYTQQALNTAAPYGVMLPAAPSDSPASPFTQSLRHVTPTQHLHPNPVAQAPNPPSQPFITPAPSPQLIENVMAPPPPKYPSQPQPAYPPVQYDTSANVQQLPAGVQQFQTAQQAPAAVQQFHAPLPPQRRPSMTHSASPAPAHPSSLHLSQNPGMPMPALHQQQQQQQQHPSAASSAAAGTHVCGYPGCGKVFGRMGALQAHMSCHVVVGEAPHGAVGPAPPSVGVVAPGGAGGPGDEEAGGAKSKPYRYLKRHYYIHSTEKPYMCMRCGKGFARRDALKRHEKAVAEGKKVHCNLLSGPGGAFPGAGAGGSALHQPGSPYYRMGSTGPDVGGGYGREGTPQGMYGMGYAGGMEGEE
ncbi:hypothetical protein HK101_010635 [Irineochytrium annulatum]|nr:hypothetical protein HK101_010635 [Irineochytrium annulatum]